jgi:hypothetical protein
MYAEKYIWCLTAPVVVKNPIFKVGQIQVLSSLNYIGHFSGFTPRCHPAPIWWQIALTYFLVSPLVPYITNRSHNLVSPRVQFATSEPTTNHGFTPGGTRHQSVLPLPQQNLVSPRLPFNTNEPPTNHSFNTGGIWHQQVSPPEAVMYMPSFEGFRFCANKIRINQFCCFWVIGWCKQQVATRQV